MIVTIDGPSGSGKSTSARLLAKRLGFEFLDTGSMFRALALFCLREKLDAGAEDIGSVLATVGLRVEAGRVWLNNVEVTHSIRTPEVSAESSRIAVYPPIRLFLAAQQRQVALGRDMITEGRDQGTAVFPDAEVKFFLTADPEIRAERRYRELSEKGSFVTLAEVLADQRERDRRDASREMAPLVMAKDAVQIDTSRLDIDEVIARMESEVRRCRAG